MNKRLAISLSILTSLVGGLLVDGVGAQDDQSPDDAALYSNRLEVVIPAEDGTIAWKDVSSLASSLKLDAPTLEGIFPSGSLDLQQATTAFALRGIDIALGKAVSFDIVRDADGETALRVTCDRTAIRRILASERKAKIASIDLDEDWERRSQDRSLVLCLHGLKSDPTRFDDFRKFLRESGLATGTASYDDYQSMITSARQLSELAEKTFQPPNAPNLVLVGHSMGGLVAREWTENPRLHNQQIVALITAGTPHGGSNWASMPPLLDLVVDPKFVARDLVDVLLHLPSAPGLRELAPDSDFLKKLNARKRRPDVRYATFYGTRSPVSPRQVARLREALEEIRGESPAVRLLQPRIAPLLGSFDELVEGKGDGVVAAERTRMEDVDDIVAADVIHGEFFGVESSKKREQVWEAIRGRIQ